MEPATQVKNAHPKVEFKTDHAQVDLESAASVSVYPNESKPFSHFPCCFMPVTIGCGTTVRDNCSYLVQSAVTTGLTVPCTYSVCKVSNNICRIRYDFTVQQPLRLRLLCIFHSPFLLEQIFTLTGPASGTVVATGTGGGTTAAGSIGQCVDDSFVVASPGAAGSPLICGSNSGYHSTVVTQYLQFETTQPLPVFV